MKPYVEKIVGIVVVASFALVFASFVRSYVPAQPVGLPMPPEPLPFWFWTYRGFDILFLCLAIFAAMLGASALFRPEKGEVAGEKALVAGPEVLEEEIEE